MARTENPKPDTAEVQSGNAAAPSSDLRTAPSVPQANDSDNIGKEDSRPNPNDAKTRSSSFSSSSLSKTKPHLLLRTIYWVPPWCRYDPKHPPKFTIWHNILFAFAGGCTVANLYYNHPILNVLAEEFHTSQAGVSRIPTLMQAGYATGLILVLPLGDLLPIRRLTLTCILFTATLWIGLCLTAQFTTFVAISYITSITTVTPQIMLPLVAGLVAPEHRAVSLSIVGSGNALGIVIARITSGVVTNYTSWRNIYWLALGLQFLILILLWLFMPDYPTKNPLTARELIKTYPQILWFTLMLLKKHAVLVQSGIISFCTSVTFTCYWTTLTFLLANSPYNYDSVQIGLFGLIGLTTVSLNSVYGKYIIKRLREPLFSIIVGLSINLIGILIGTYSGKKTVAGPIIQGLLLDASFQIVGTSNRIAVYFIEPGGRNRVNTAFMLVTFLGQLTGTSAGNALYERYGGWIASGSLSVGVIIFSLVVVALRGPYEKRWFGWRGGWGLVPSQQNAAEDEEEQAGTSGVVVLGELKDDDSGKEKAGDKIGEDAKDSPLSNPMADAPRQI